MHIVDALQAGMTPVEAPEAAGVEIQWLLDEQAGAPHFAMRRFVIAPGGHTPFHVHDWEHEVYILDGAGLLVTEEKEHPLQADLAVLVPAGEKHQFRAAPGEELEFLCLVPNGPATER